MDKFKALSMALLKAMSAFTIVKAFIKDPTVEAAVAKFIEAIKELESVALRHDQIASDQTATAKAATDAAAAAQAESDRARNIAAKIAAIVQ